MAGASHEEEVAFLPGSAARSLPQQVCRGHLYLPPDSPEHSQPTTQRKLPVVILAHGLCCLQSFEPIPTMVSFFLRAGFACLTFDYRGFGESWSSTTAAPPQLIDPAEHCTDWRAAIMYAHQHPSLDPERIALWGTSFSGGHVLCVAASPPSGTSVRAFVSQVGCMDFAASRVPSGITIPWFMWRLGLSWAARSCPSLWPCGGKKDPTKADIKVDYRPNPSPLGSRPLALSPSRPLTLSPCHPATLPPCHSAAPPRACYCTGPVKQHARH